MKRHKLTILLVILLICILACSLLVKKISGQRISNDLYENYLYYKNQEELKASRHVKKPDTVRGLYLTAYSASREEVRERLVQKYKKDGINTLVIDIKDYSGHLLYDTDLKEVEQVGAEKITFDVRQVIDELHEAGYYLIARQTVFQDPILSNARPNLALKDYQGNVWREWSGLSWLDPSKQEVHEYNLAIAKEAINLGFDEINFDYIRYPSDGNLKNLNYNMPAGSTRADVLGQFYKYMSDNLSDLANISFDFFGMVMDYPDGSYDLGIGQRLMDIVDYTDFICPMMYPSHYPDGYLGMANPALYPGSVIGFGLDKSADLMNAKRAKVRPWLQAFHIGAYYDQSKIKAQIGAVEEREETDGWLLWNAGNNYPDYIFGIFE